MVLNRRKFFIYEFLICFIEGFLCIHKEDVLKKVFVSMVSGFRSSIEHVQTPMYFAGVRFEDLHFHFRCSSIMHIRCVFTWSEGYIFSKTYLGISS